MLKIVFEYHDKWCKDGRWNTQTCYVPSLEECIKIYGLGEDCSYRIVSIEEVKNF